MKLYYYYNMILEIQPIKKVTTGLLVLILPFMMSCSVFSGSTSNDPMVVAQKQQVDILEEEVNAQKRRTDEAEQLYKREKDLLSAKKSELKAAERLLKVYDKQASQR